MPDLPTIFASVIEKCGEKARPTIGGELKHNGSDWLRRRQYDTGYVLITLDEADAANAIRCHWEDMLLAKGHTVELSPFEGEIYIDSYHAPTLIEALAKAVQGECAK